jgi:hypothetical protein
MKMCIWCGKETSEYHNFCSNSDCQINKAIADGGRIHCPNGLPIRSITRDGLLLEHEHGDHPTYMFPVMVEYFGEKVELPEWDDSYADHDHALIYTDGHVAMTLHECCYFLWLLDGGVFLHGSSWLKEGWRMSADSVIKIRQLIKKKD